jgi:hypothetical protein
MQQAVAIRLGAYAAIASLVLALAALASFLVAVGSDEIADAAGSAGFYFASSCALASLLLLPLALLALWLVQRDRMTSFGTWAFIAALLGTMLAVGASWTYVFVVPYFAEAAPELVNGGSGVLLAGFLISYAALALGWVAFALATLRTKTFPRWEAVLLIFGGGIAILPMPSRTLVLALALALIGMQLLRQPTSRA